MARKVRISAALLALIEAREHHIIFSGLGPNCRIEQARAPPWA
jgi:hypothetical protein